MFASPERNEYNKRDPMHLEYFLKIHVVIPKTKFISSFNQCDNFLNYHYHNNQNLLCGFSFATAPQCVDMCQF